MLRYLKTKHNEHLLVDSVLNDLSDTEKAQVAADDMVIQSVLLGLPNDVFVTVDALESAYEVWNEVKTLMEGNDVGLQDKKSTLLWKFSKLTSIPGESLASYYNRFATLKNNTIQYKVTLDNKDINIIFLNNLQPKRKCYVILIKQTKDLNTTTIN
ncbi:hypothetical protein Tco_1564886 [Tanacetum coccineum]